jgi:hypothetical protein
MVVKFNGKPLWEATEGSAKADVRAERGEAHAEEEASLSRVGGGATREGGTARKPRTKRVPTRHVRRPKQYPAWVRDEFLDLIARGATVTGALKMEGMPSIPTIYEWLDNVPGFRERFEAARVLQRAVWESEIVDLIDEVQILDISETTQHKNKSTTRGSTSRDRIAKAKEQRASRMWLLQHQDPRYAPKTAGGGNTTNMHGNNTITVINSPDIEDAANTELAEQAAGRNAVPVEDYSRKVSTNPLTDV